MPVNPLRPDLPTLRRGAEAIRRGQVIAAPTDTLYGLLADARSDRALRAVFRAKSRPQANPILLLVDSVRGARRVARRIPEPFNALADALWPGPLTIVLPARPTVPDLVTAGGATVAVRVPRSPLVIGLAKLSRCPLTLSLIHI